MPVGRILILNEAPVTPDGDFVLYWMVAHRRVTWNFGLQRAVEWARDLKKPLLILETLSCGRRWDSDRFHSFVLDGMADSARTLERTTAHYYPYVEPSSDKATGLIRSLADRACLIVTDHFPTHVVPETTRAVLGRAPVLVEAVDSNGLLPLRAADTVFTTAYSFRRFLQEALPEHLSDSPKASPLARTDLPALRALPPDITRRWPKATATMLRRTPPDLAALPIDHSIRAARTRGGARAARAALRHFLKERLPRYAEARNEPEEEVTSGLSPYLHYGHISSHQVFAELMKQERWSPADISHKTAGSRRGWWGVSEPAEAFLDQLVTWRELGFNMCWQSSDYDQYESLPEWARRTLNEHARDFRPHLYSPEQLEASQTHDPLWNAAQMQLVRDGRLHNYLRMLWGKKILEWSPTPRDALDVMIELNNKYALDGQDPNSYSGIFWVLGRYDRAWGPERPIFGKIRYMSSENTARKVRVKSYIKKYAP